MEETYYSVSNDVKEIERKRESWIKNGRKRKREGFRHRDGDLGLGQRVLCAMTLCQT